MLGTWREVDLTQLQQQKPPCGAAESTRSLIGPLQRWQLHRRSPPMTLGSSSPPGKELSQQDTGFLLLGNGCFLLQNSPHHSNPRRHPPPPPLRRRVFSDIIYTTAQRLRPQIRSGLGNIASHFISSLLTGSSAGGHDYRSTCVMETIPPRLGIPSRFHYNTTIRLLHILMVSGEGRSCPKRRTKPNTVSSVASHQHRP